ncbi:hypothetical protein H072_5870 [Dactylellina haptotyla CBS 200.50]|uniref:RecF/RecN/SMC N-terminal domain-containing protein n=1 Tax=Dactylellina haptotyla (strain CBS 200.50) TaxID=1284197 RepID=S8ABM9_DACHA|nr:hypothetical protein H072_5870 [Dactylellina haptotyla CBS 200.50]
MSTKRPRPRHQSGENQGLTQSEGEYSHQTAKKRKTASLNALDEEGVDSDEDALYLEQSQRLPVNLLAAKGNEPADYGTIELIKLENFMCHSCLEIKFGPFMNFVVGQNGSGKSAVLTALTLCLGAKATVTNRGGNIKSFIKEGEHTAVVEVHLRNRGDGFKKNIYGETIVVQRTFNRDGVNSYKTKAKNGKTISTAKKELSDIIDYMSLQVDNPMTVLSQDLARQFLSNSTDEDKYKFFMKGVQLDDLYALYQTMKSQQSTIENVLESKAEDIRELKEEKEAAEKKFRLLKQTEDLRNTLQELLLRHAWAQVSESEAVGEAVKEEIAGSEDTRKTLDNELEKANAAINEWDSKVAEARAAVESSSDRNNPLKEEKKEIEERLNKQSQKLTKVQQEERTVHQHMKQAQTKIDRAKREVEAEKQRLSDIDDGKNASMVAEKEKLSIDKLRIEREQAELDSQYETEKSESTNRQMNLQQAAEAVSRKERDIQAAKATLRMLESGQSNNLNVYGENTAPLLKAISREKWISKAPIGPIGLLIKLKNKDWSQILEKQLNRLLSGFIAFTLEDKDRLMGNHTVFYSSPNSFQLKEPAEEYLTVLRALDVTNEEVRKTLITIHNVEQTILVEDHVEARRIMERGPENVRFCYSINKQKRGNGFSVKMGLVHPFQGSGGVDPIVGWVGPNRMVTDVEEQIKSIKENIVAFDLELKAIQEKYYALEQAANSSETLARDYTRNKQLFKTELQRIDDQIEDITHKLEQDNTNRELIKLEKAVEAHEESYETYAEQFRDNANEKERISEVRNELEAQLENIKNKINESEAQSDTLQTAHNYAIQQREKAVLSNSNTIQKIEAQETKIEELKAAARTSEDSLTKMISHAEEVGSRVVIPARETTKKIEARLEQLNAELEKKDASIGASTEQIAKDFVDKTEKYNDARNEVSDLELIHKAFDQAFEERMERWHYFRKHISVTSRLQFHYLMSEREFDGQLKFDHIRGILQLKVQPSQQATDTQRNAKTLSGGEKSFSQICLLLALWEAMGSPFRCLDEFDVFMDAVNRGVSMGLIIKAARNSVGKQFILITPQDVSTKGIDETADNA